MCCFCSKRCLANGTKIWQISAYKFGLNFVGEIERQLFCQTTVRRRLFAWQTKFGNLGPMKNQAGCINQTCMALTPLTFSIPVAGFELTIFRS